MAKATVAPVVAEITVSSSSMTDSGIGAWVTRKLGDSVEVAGEAAGEIHGAFDASGEAYTATREVSRSTRVANVRARAVARAKAAGIKLSFS